ncbi:MAG: cell envelope integrity protein TolA [Bdellovibrionales bacterium]|nr:cell envelope integrity protein TolA [Bdellovibrionales bacterium]
METRKIRSWPFIISLLLHLGLFAFLIVHKKFQLTHQDPVVEIEWVDVKDLPSPTEMRQVVQQDKTVNDEVPVDEYKLSQFDQNVLKETRAAKTGAFKNTSNTNQGMKQKPNPTKPPKKKFSLNDLKPKMINDDFSAEKLAPNPDSPRPSGGDVSQNDDYLKDVVIGAETLLKTREFVYYSYYNRIKNKLRQHWEPRIKEKIVHILRKGRTIASTNAKITRLVITLDQSGELVRVQVKNASGYNDLDDAAIEAFRAAAPFPNPPAGIVNNNGNIQIDWDFVLET